MRALAVAGVFGSPCIRVSTSLVPGAYAAHRHTAAASCHLEQHLWMLGRDQEQRPRGAGWGAAALLPILQRAYGHTEQARELRLRKAGAFADAGDVRHLGDTAMP